MQGAGQMLPHLKLLLLLLLQAASSANANNNTTDANLALVLRFYELIDATDTARLGTLAAPGYTAVFGPGCAVIGQAFHEGEETLDIAGLGELLRRYEDRGADRSYIKATANQRVLVAQRGGVVINHYSHEMGGDRPALHGAAVHKVSAAGQLITSFWYGGSSSCRSADGFVAEWEASLSTSTSLFLFLVLVLIALAITADTFFRQRGVLWLPGAVSSMLLGLGLGLLLRSTHDAQLEALLEFDASLFVLVLLPMIIFEAGYSLDKQGFFSHLTIICVNAIFGTMLSTLMLAPVIFVIARASFAGGSAEDHVSLSGDILRLVPNPPLSYTEALAFAALLSAIDPVATISIFRSLGNPCIS